LSGNLEEGLRHVDKALEINPHAHFDRERYQKWIVEYAITCKKDGQLHFPMRDSSNSGAHTFADFLADKLHLDKRLPLSESQKAVNAILGMMRFADYDNPLVLEALGDLLCKTERQNDAKRLATRAYLAASYKFKGKEEEDKYRQLAEWAIRMQTVNAFSGKQLSLAELERDFRAERAEAENWYSNLKGREISWIRQGINVDNEFDKLYKSEPEVFDKNSIPIIGALLPSSLDSWFVLIWGSLIGTIVIGIVRENRRRLSWFVRE
jgi:hypothetical protein